LALVKVRCRVSEGDDGCSVVDLWIEGAVSNVAAGKLARSVCASEGRLEMSASSA
jgi:hypothetical protein